MKNSLTKRLAAAVLGALLCMTACVTAFADSKPIVIKECDNLEITLPDNMSAITRSSESTDSYFKTNHLDYNEIMSNFENNNIYLQATDSNVNAITLTLSCIETEGSKKTQSFSQLTDAQLASAAANYISSSTADTKYNSSTQDEAGKSLVWIYFNMTAEGHTQYQATTVQNGKSFSLTLYRNGTDVTYADYNTLQMIVSGVKIPAPKAEETGIMAFIKNNMLLVCCVGAGLIVLIILLVVIIKSAKRRKKKTNNDKIIEELAGKYTTRQNGHNTAYTDYQSDETDEAYAAEPEMYTQPAEDETYAESDDSESYDDYDYDYDVADRKYSDADIARLLGDDEGDENFIDALPATQADSDDDAEVRDSVIEEADTISEFFEDEIPEEAEEAAPVAEETATSAYLEEPVDEAAEENADDAEEVTEELAEDETGEADDELEEAAEDEAEEEPDATEETEDEEFEEYASDEELVREESNQDKFKDSSDFFEEAPKKIIGVISSKEIEAAEEYDVINEEEHRAEKIEHEAPKEQGFSGGAKKFSDSLKNFWVHCGYFVTNVKRSIKRRRAIKRRKKEEEARRQRQMERRARERRAREHVRDNSSGLVQVRRRDERSQNSNRR